MPKHDTPEGREEIFKWIDESKTEELTAYLDLLTPAQRHGFFNTPYPTDTPFVERSIIQYCYKQSRPNALRLFVQTPYVDSIDATKVNIQEAADDNVRLILLKIPSIKTGIMENPTASSIRMLNALTDDELNEFLSDPIIAHNSELVFNILKFAVQNQHNTFLSRVLSILNYPGSAADNLNELLMRAVWAGNINQVTMLLRVKKVRENAQIDNNAMLNHAWTSGNADVFFTLIQLPSVQRELFTDDFAQLRQLVDSNPAIPLDSLGLNDIYGVPIRYFLNDPIADLNIGPTLQDLSDFLIDHHYQLQQNQLPANQFLAIAIIMSEQAYKDERRALAALERNGQRFNNADDEERIRVINAHFKDIIEPYLRNTYEAYGETDEERLDAIELEIRQLILNKIYEQAIENMGAVGNPQIVAYIDELTTEKRTELCKGKNPELMAEARALFNHATSHSQTAWRAYDAWAPVNNQDNEKHWPNLLTPPITGGNISAFTLDAVGLDNSTRATASAMARKRAAYSFLLAKDPADGSQDTRLLRFGVFIDLLAEIRRAHNSDPEVTDEPSCLPGSIRRAGEMWVGHAKELVPTVSTLIKEELVTVVIAKFKQLPAVDREAVYQAIVNLNDKNAEMVISGADNLSDEAVELRRQFIESLGSAQELKAVLNAALIARGSRAITDHEYNQQVGRLLTNIGGSWLSTRLGEVHQEQSAAMQVVENPFADVVNNATDKISKIEAIKLLRVPLSSAGMTRHLMAWAEVLSKDGPAAFGAFLKGQNVGQAVIDDIGTLINNHLKQQNAGHALTKRKVQLWNALYQHFGNQLRGKEDSIREIVNRVINVEQTKAEKLVDVLASNKLTASSGILAQLEAIVRPEPDRIKIYQPKFGAQRDPSKSMLMGLQQSNTFFDEWLQNKPDFVIVAANAIHQGLQSEDTSVRQLAKSAMDRLVQKALENPSTLKNMETALSDCQSKDKVGPATVLKDICEKSKSAMHTEAAPAKIEVKPGT